jgi:hypothetical protein
MTTQLRLQQLHVTEIRRLLLFIMLFLVSQQRTLIGSDGGKNAHDGLAEHHRKGNRYMTSLPVASRSINRPPLQKRQNTEPSDINWE